jgi:iron complex outermembrane receptor protein
LFTRSKLLFTPSDATKFTLSGNYSRVDFDPIIFNVPGSTPIGGLVGFENLPPHDATSPYDSNGKVTQYGGSLTSEIDFHPLRLLSITAYEGTDATNLFGTIVANPLVTANLLLVEPHRQISQEFQLSSPNEGFLTWTAGLYYFHEKALYDPVHLFGPLYYTPDFPLTDILYHTTSKTDSYAAYAQATMTVRPDTHLTMGFRYTQEKRSIGIINDLVGIDPVSGTPGIPLGTLTTDESKSFHAPTWRIALDHSFTPEVLGYISYNRGFKSGGFNPAQVPAVDYKPEKLDAYELGLKSQTTDHRLRVNAAAFWYNYSQIQVESFANQILLISNGAKARMYGLDIDGEAAVTGNFVVHVGASALHARFTDYPQADKTTPVPFDPANPYSGGNTYSVESATGHPIPRAPSFMLSAGGDYTIPLTTGYVDVSLNYSYNSGWNAEADERLKQKAYNVVDARLSWTSPDKKYEVDLWGKNLLDTDYALTMFSQQAYDELHWAPPRTFGVTAKLRFGGR